jgi:hypothetical protein
MATYNINRKAAIIAIAVAGVASAILVAAVVIPRPVSAFGPARWMMHGGGEGVGTYGGGFGQGHFGAMSEGNWTGSVPTDSVRQDVMQSIMSKVKVSIRDAESAAKGSLGDDTRIFSVSLAPVNGYIVYVVGGINPSGEHVRAVVDAGNGTVLESGTASMDGGVGAWQAHGFGGGIWR